jgi:hypothetical protein
MTTKGGAPSVRSWLGQRPESALSRRYCGPQRMRRIAPKPTLVIIPTIGEVGRKRADRASNRMGIP